MGLLGGIARTAVASGTWTAVSNRVSRRQANRWAGQEQQQQYYQGPAQQQYYQAPAQQQYYQAPGQQQQYYQQPAPAPAAPAPTSTGRDSIAQLKDLAALKEQGVLTDEEFATQKAKILAV